MIASGLLMPYGLANHRIRDGRIEQALSLTDRPDRADQFPAPDLSSRRSRQLHAMRS